MKFSIRAKLLVGFGVVVAAIAVTTALTYFSTSGVANDVKVELISSAAQQVSSSSDEMVTSIESVSAITEETTAATEQMAASNTEVQESMTQITEITRDSGAAVENSSAAAEELSSQVEEVVAASSSLGEMSDQLAKSVSVFRLEKNNIADSNAEGEALDELAA